MYANTNLPTLNFNSVRAYFIKACTTLPVIGTALQDIIALYV